VNSRLKIEERQEFRTQKTLGTFSKTLFTHDRPHGLGRGNCRKASTTAARFMYRRTSSDRRRLWTPRNPLSKPV